MTGRAEERRRPVVSVFDLVAAVAGTGFEGAPLPAA